MIKKKITVVVPIYNASFYLCECIDSIINQTYHNLEIILVDDGSTDDSLKICNEFAFRDNRIFVISKENGGQMSAWIEGVKNSHGDFFAFVDSDDTLEPNIYERMMDVSIETNADIVMCGHRNVYRDRKVDDLLIEYRNYYDSSNISEVYQLVFPNINTGISQSRWDKLFKREMLITNMELYCKKLVRTMEDRFIVSSCLLSSKSMAVIHEPLYNYRIVNNSSCKKARPELYDIAKTLYSTQKQMLIDKGLTQYASCLELSVLDLIRMIIIRNICKKNNFSFKEKEQMAEKLLNDVDFHNAVLNNKSSCYSKFGKYLYLSYKINSPFIMTLVATIYGRLYEKGNDNGF